MPDSTSIFNAWNELSSNCFKLNFQYLSFYLTFFTLFQYISMN